MADEKVTLTLTKSQCSNLKESLLVPFGTTYRIAENFVADFSGEELILCSQCQSHEPCEVRGKVWCKTMGRYMKEDGFCSEGVKDNV